jgi:hypothetical protein
VTIVLSLKKHKRLHVRYIVQSSIRFIFKSKISNFCDAEKGVIFLNEGFNNLGIYESIKNIQIH